MVSRYTASPNQAAEPQRSIPGFDRGRSGDLAGWFLGLVLWLPWYAIPVGPLVGALPFLWLLHRKSGHQAIRRRDARGGRADQSGPPRRAWPGLRAAPGGRGDEGADRR